MARAARIGIIILSVMAILVVGAVIALPLVLSHYLKQNLTAVLQERFSSQVEIKGLQVMVLPHVYASAEDIVLRYKGRTDVPPLMMIHRLSISATIAGLLKAPRHVDKILLQGLQIHVPPKDNTQPQQVKQPRKKFAPDILVDEIVSDDALLETLPRDPSKLPRDFQIHSLEMHSFGFDRPASFHAILTNAVPAGAIDSQGEFGPWQSDEPGDTPLAATYRFTNADFTTLRGLSGTMSSTGKYSGTLDHLDVVGDTAMSNFALNVSGNPMPLTTHYIAVVDGTNGNTYLTSVEAHLGRSTINTKGEVVGVPGVPGRHILLDAVSRSARMEDFLRLVVKGNHPVMTGDVSLRSKIEIRPGKGDLLERLLLNGQFGIVNAHFTDPGTQNKLDSLSRRGQGQPKDQDIEDVISNLRGRFIVSNGKATLSNLTFNVPGARVELAGAYDMKSEALDFHGHLLLDAKISQTVTGKKSLLLRFVDPFFKRSGGGSSIPIKIVGTRSQPEIGLDLHHHDAHPSKAALPTGVSPRLSSRLRP